MLFVVRELVAELCDHTRSETTIFITMTIANGSSVCCHHALNNYKPTECTHDVCVCVYRRLTGSGLVRDIDV